MTATASAVNGAEVHKPNNGDIIIQAACGLYKHGLPPVDLIMFTPGDVNDDALLDTSWDSHAFEGYLLVQSGR
jgi:hypothetical protein